MALQCSQLIYMSYQKEYAICFCFFHSTCATLKRSWSIHARGMRSWKLDQAGAKACLISFALSPALCRSNFLLRAKKSLSSRMSTRNACVYMCTIFFGGYVCMCFQLVLFVHQTWTRLWWCPPWPALCVQWKHHCRPWWQQSKLNWSRSKLVFNAGDLKDNNIIILDGHMLIPDQVSIHLQLMTCFSTTVIGPCTVPAKKNSWPDSRWIHQWYRHAKKSNSNISNVSYAHAHAHMPWNAAGCAPISTVSSQQDCSNWPSSWASFALWGRSTCACKFISNEIQLKPCTHPKGFLHDNLSDSWSAWQGCTALLRTFHTYLCQSEKYAGVLDLHGAVAWDTWHEQVPHTILE